MDGRYSTLTGSGDLVRDSAGVIFEAAERALRTTGELRLLPDSVHWGFVIGIEVRSERRVRNDLAAALGSRVNDLTTRVSVEAGHAVSPSVYVTGSVAAANYSAKSAFPAPSVLGSIYRTYTLPGLEVEARQAQPLLLAVGLKWRAGPTTSVWLVTRGERLSPVGPQGPTGSGPRGTRTAIGVEGGVTLR